MDTIRPELQKAVALHYDGRGAPKILARGSGAAAEEIRQRALQSQVPTCENAALVEVLSKIEVGETIPQAVYVAVAHIIAFAYQLRSLHDAPDPPSRAATRMENLYTNRNNNVID